MPPLCNRYGPGFSCIRYDFVLCSITKKQGAFWIKKPKERAGKEKKMQNWFDTAPDHRKNRSYRWEQPAGREDVIGMGTADLDIAARNV